MTIRFFYKVNFKEIEGSNYSLNNLNIYDFKKSDIRNTSSPRPNRLNSIDEGNLKGFLISKTKFF